ncbi:MAG: imelysin family protein [Chthoniobacterales bacterium]
MKRTQVPPMLPMAVLAALSFLLPQTSAGKQATADVKSYLLGALMKIEVAADAFVRDATAYDALVQARNGDPLQAFATSPAEVTRLVESLREEYKAMDSFGYETIEGIVAGVPALADFDVYLDSGVPKDQAGGGTPVAPVILALPRGGKIDHKGCLFTYLIEPMLWGSNAKLVIAADLDHDGKIGAHESLPRADALLAVATDVRAKIDELHKAAIAWQPATPDYFAAIITMTPTLSGYFDDWKDSRFGATSGKFTAVSRVSDMRGIMSSVAILYRAVQQEVAGKDPALASSIERGFDGILAFIDRVERREKKAGTEMTAAEVDELGEQAKQKADKLVPQVEQAAAILELQPSAGT